MPTYYLDCTHSLRGEGIKFAEQKISILKISILHKANCAERLINENSERAELFYGQYIIKTSTQIESLTCLLSKSGLVFAGFSIICDIN